MNKQVKIIVGMIVVTSIITAGSSTISIDGTTILTIEDNLGKLFLAIDNLDKKIDRVQDNVQDNVQRNINVVRSEQQQEFQQIKLALKDVRSDILGLQKDNLAMREDIQGLGEDSKRLNSALAKVTEVLQALRDEVEQTKLALLQIKVEQQQEFQQIKVSLVQINGALQDLSEEVDRINTTVGQIKTEQQKGFNDVKSVLQQITIQVGDLSTEVRQIESKIQKLEEDVNMNKGDLAVLKVQITSIKAVLDKLTDLIKSIDNKVIIVDRFPHHPFGASPFDP